LARLAGVIDLPVSQDPNAEEGPAGSSLRTEAIGHTYAPGAPQVLDQVSVKIDPGERVALVGASGAGKTTLAAVVSGLRTPTSGTVFLGGDRKSTRLNSSHVSISYAVFCLKKQEQIQKRMEK